MTQDELQQLVNKLLDEYPILWQNGFMIEYVTDYNFIGAVNTLNPNDLLIQINTDFTEINDTPLVWYALLHETAHAIDYIRNGGWRLSKKPGKIKYHDKEFRKICKELGISGNAKSRYLFNVPGKKLKKFKPDDYEFLFDLEVFSTFDNGEVNGSIEYKKVN
jgi:hypothetical protein